MQVSLNWLNEFVDLSDIEVEQIAHELTMSGLEVEAVEEVKPKFTNIKTVKIEKIDSCEDAEELRNAFLYIDKASAKKPDDSYFIADLIGMKVMDQNSKEYGELKEIFNTGSVDIYCVNSQKNFMFPAAPGVIIDINESTRIITVDNVRLSEVAVYDWV